MKTNSIEITEKCEQPISLQRPCHKLVTQLAAVRERIEAGLGLVRESNRQLIRLALNEAEALAWQTPYPHLFFPALAEEKVAALARWESRQAALHRREPEFAFAE